MGKDLDEGKLILKRGGFFPLSTLALNYKGGGAN